MGQGNGSKDYHVDFNKSGGKYEYEYSQGIQRHVPPSDERKLNEVRGQLLNIERRSRESSRDRDANFIQSSDDFQRHSRSHQKSPNPNVPYQQVKPPLYVQGPNYDSQNQRSYPHQNYQSQQPQQDMQRTGP